MNQVKRHKLHQAGSCRGHLLAGGQTAGAADHRLLHAERRPYAQRPAESWFRMLRWRERALHLDANAQWHGLVAILRILVVWSPGGLHTRRRLRSQRRRLCPLHRLRQPRAHRRGPAAHQGLEQIAKQAHHHKEHPFFSGGSFFCVFDNSLTLNNNVSEQIVKPFAIFCHKLFTFCQLCAFLTIKTTEILLFLQQSVIPLHSKHDKSFIVKCLINYRY